MNIFAPRTLRGKILETLELGEASSFDLWQQFGALTHIALEDLMDMGLIQSRQGEPVKERGGRPRFYYRLADIKKENLTK